MKKSVILAIGFIYIFSIIIVGFLGMKLKVFDEPVDVAEIVCKTEGYIAYTNEDKVGKEKLLNNINGHIEREFNEKTGLKVNIKCDVLPANADHKKLAYEFDKNTKVYTLSVNADGTAIVSFNKPGTAVITIRATDNTGIYICIEINANDSGQFY